MKNSHLATLCKTRNLLYNNTITILEGSLICPCEGERPVVFCADTKDQTLACGPDPPNHRNTRSCGSRRRFRHLIFMCG